MASALSFMLRLSNPSRVVNEVEERTSAGLSKQRERRERAVAKAEAAIQDTKRDHDKRASTIEAERTALEKRSRAEDARWEKQRQKLEIALRRARG